jgi:hypothetical protein
MESSFFPGRQFRSVQLGTIVLAAHYEEMVGRSLWNEDKLQRLRQHVANGGSVARASVIFGTSVSQVRQKAREGGFPFPTLRENQARQKAAALAPVQSNEVRRK